MNEEDTQKFFEDQKKQTQLEIFEKEFKANNFKKKQPDGVFFNEKSGKFEKLPEYELIDKEISQMLTDEKSDLKHFHAKNVKEELSKKVIENPEKSTEILRSNIKKIDLKEAMKDLNPDLVKEILSKEVDKMTDFSEKKKDKSVEKSRVYSRERHEKSREKEQKSEVKHKEKSCNRGREKSTYKEKTQTKERYNHSNRSREKSEFQPKEKSQYKKNNYELRNRNKSRDVSAAKDSNFFSRDKSKSPVNHTNYESYQKNYIQYQNTNQIYNPHQHHSNRSRSPTPSISGKTIPQYMMNRKINNSPLNNFNGYIHKNILRHNSGLPNISNQNESMSYYHNYTYEDPNNFIPKRKFNLQSFSPINLMSPLPSKMNIDLTSDDEVPILQTEISKYQKDPPVGKFIPDIKKYNEIKDVHNQAKQLLINNLQQITQQNTWKDLCDFNNYVKSNFSFNEQNIFKEFQYFREICKGMQNSSLLVCLFYYLWLVRSREKIELKFNKREIGSFSEKEKSFLDFHTDDKNSSQNDNIFYQKIPTTIINNSKNHKKNHFLDNSKLMQEDIVRSKSKVDCQNEKRDKSLTPQRKLKNVDLSIQNEEYKNNFAKDNFVKKNYKIKNTKASQSETSLDNSTSTLNVSQNVFLKQKRGNDSGELKKKNSKKHKVVEESDNEVKL